MVRFTGELRSLLGSDTENRRERVTANTEVQQLTKLNRRRKPTRRSSLSGLW